MNLENLKNRYMLMFGEEGVSPGDREKIERALDLELPKDFSEICGFYRGGVLGGVPMLEIASGDTENIITETKRLREAAGLHKGYLLLADLSESVIVMNCNHNEQFGNIFWLDSPLAGQMLRAESVGSGSCEHVWESYGEFFEFLLTGEEDDRAGMDRSRDGA